MCEREMRNIISSFLSGKCIALWKRQRLDISGNICRWASALPGIYLRPPEWEGSQPGLSENPKPDDIWLVTAVDESADEI